MKKRSVFTRVPRIKDPVVRVELSRAHLMISLLAVTLIVCLVLPVGEILQTQPLLEGILTGVLGLVALFSVAVAIRSRQS